MCEHKHCSRNGCENHVPANRTDDFCSSKCKKTDEILRFSALKESFGELRISHSEFIGRVKRSCQREGCTNPVKRTKFCSLKCYHENRKQKKIRKCVAIGCETMFHAKRASTQFCSRKCYWNTVKLAEKICENKNCENKLNPRLQKRFCSRKCCHEFKYGIVEKRIVCQRPECGTKLSDIKTIDRGRDRKYCSRRCYDIARTELKSILGTTKLVKRKHWEYPRRFIKTENGWKMMSVFTWEKHNGPLPKRHMIVFNDGDSFNDQDINNLGTISISENLLKKRSTGKFAKKQIVNEENPVNNEVFMITDNIII